MSLTLLIPVLGQVLDKIFPDQDKANEAKAKLLEMQLNGELTKIEGQLEINKQEAAHESIFVAGWRPAIGWVCALALAFQFLIRPILTAFHAFPNDIPGLDGMLWELMFGMLGMGALRTVEKVKLK